VRVTSQPGTPADTAPLERWLEDVGRGATTLERLAGDISQRRYYRVVQEDGGTTVLAVYPPALSGAYEAFLRTSGWLERLAVTVPAILRCDRARGLMLLEDVGQQTLYDAPLSELERQAYAQEAARIAHRIALLPRAQVARLHPPIDALLMQREVDQTWSLLLDSALQHRPDLGIALRSALVDLIDRLSNAPRAPAHRDLMARNLVPRDGKLVVLDHQDLRLAPLHYDLASLFFDSQPLAGESRLALWHEALGPTADRLLAGRVVVQRMLKIVGTFRAFALRGEGRYLPLIPDALETALVQLAQLPECGEPLADALRTVLSSDGLLSTRVGNGGTLA
jgi:hypothetical protein